MSEVRDAPLITDEELDNIERALADQHVQHMNENRAFLAALDVKLSLVSEVRRLRAEVDRLNAILDRLP